ncbi:MAG TPA: hypothetical protein VLB73_05240 [Patescibacteria group bacterium]|nr:hypothetical protein [Patescibacteria group bacterium]
MELSLFLAKLIGVYLIVVCGVLLVRKKDIGLLIGLSKHPEVIYLSGLIDVFFGLLIVLVHNVWAMDFRAIITVMGWVLLLRGVWRMLSPESISRMVEKYRALRSILVPAMVVAVLVGAYLAYVGFTG